MRIVFLLILLVITHHTLVDAKKRTARPRRELIAETGPSDEMIWDTGLVERDLSAAAVVERGQQWYERVDIKKFKGPVLGYVTPWHRKGYETAARFRAKLTHVAPVWHQLKRKDQVWILEGGHEYNKTWMDDVRQPVGEAASQSKIVPRVIVELDTAEDHVSLVQEPGRVIELLTQEVVSKDYDGIVLEVWMIWVHMNAMNNDQFSKLALNFMKQLSHSLKSAPGRPRQLILAVPPVVPASHARPFIERKHLQTFSPYVDFWSVMTYDFASGDGARPNSPIKWLEAQRKLLFDPDEAPSLSSPSQALMGINFYGYDYHLKAAESTQTIIASEVIAILSKQQPAMEWDDEHAEHHFDYQALDGKHRVFYPTPRSLEMRLEMFDKWGVGISIWELGQGLERFFDLL